MGKSATTLGDMGYPGISGVIVNRKYEVKHAMNK